MLRSVSFKVFLHFIVKLKPKVIANLPLRVGRRVHPLNENVSEAITGRFIHCLLQKNGRMSRFRNPTSVGRVGENPGNEVGAFEVSLHFTRKFKPFKKCFLF